MKRLLVSALLLATPFHAPAETTTPGSGQTGLTQKQGDAIRARLPQAYSQRYGSQNRSGARTEGIQFVPTAYYWNDGVFVATAYRPVKLARQQRDLASNSPLAYTAPLANAMDSTLAPYRFTPHTQGGLLTAYRLSTPGITRNGYSFVRRTLAADSTTPGQTPAFRSQKPAAQSLPEPAPAAAP
jgi:hypothetical protein